MLTRARKEQIVSDLTTIFQENEQTIFVIEPKGVDTQTLTTLRVGLRAFGGSMRMVKNTLASMAVKETAYEDLSPFFKGVSVLLVGTDSLGMAKAVNAFMKEHEDALSYKGGVMDGTPVSVEMLVQLAKMPSIEELRAQLVGVLASPASELTRVLKAKPTSIITVLSKKMEKGD